MFEGVHKTLSQNTDLQKKIFNYTFIGSKRQTIYYIVHKTNCAIEDEGLDNTVVVALLLLKHTANSAMTVLVKMGQNLKAEVSQPYQC